MLIFIYILLSSNIICSELDRNWIYLCNRPPSIQKKKKPISFPHIEFHAKIIQHYRSYGMHRVKLKTMKNQETALLPICIVKQSIHLFHPSKMSSSQLPLVPFDIFTFPSAQCCRLPSSHACIIRIVQKRLNQDIPVNAKCPNIFIANIQSFAFNLHNTDRRILSFAISVCIGHLDLYLDGCCAVILDRAPSLLNVLTINNEGLEDRMHTSATPGKNAN